MPSICVINLEHVAPVLERYGFNVVSGTSLLQVASDLRGLRKAQEDIILVTQDQPSVGLPEWLMINTPAKLVLLSSSHTSGVDLENAIRLDTPASIGSLVEAFGFSANQPALDVLVIDEFFKVSQDATSVESTPPEQSLTPSVEPVEPPQASERPVEPVEPPQASERPVGTPSDPPSGTSSSLDALPDFEGVDDTPSPLVSEDTLDETPRKPSIFERLADIQQSGDFEEDEPVEGSAISEWVAPSPYHDQGLADDAPLPVVDIADPISDPDWVDGNDSLDVVTPAPATRAHRETEPIAPTVDDSMNMPELHCTQCGSQSVPGAKFCPECGTPAAAQSDPPSSAPTVQPEPAYNPPPPPEPIPEPVIQPDLLPAPAVQPEPVYDPPPVPAPAVQPEPPQLPAPAVQPEPVYDPPPTPEPIPEPVIQPNLPPAPEPPDNAPLLPSPPVITQSSVQPNQSVELANSFNDEIITDLNLGAVSDVANPTVHRNDGARVIISIAGKGGVGKSSLALFLGQRAASKGGLKVIVIDANRGQGDIVSYLRLGNETLKGALPTIYSSTISGNADDCILIPSQVNRYRHERLPQVRFGVVFAPPPDYADPSFVTTDAYRKVIERARELSDLVVIDTQIIEAADTSGLFNDLLVPMLKKDAWALATSDISAPSVNNIRERLQTFKRSGIPRDRLMLIFNRVNQSSTYDPNAMKQLFNDVSVYLGSVMADDDLAAGMNVGNLDHDNSVIAPILDSVLYRVTGINTFSPSQQQYGARNSGRRSNRKRR